MGTVFSNHTDNDPSTGPTLATSLEGIHDSMHDNIGGTSGRGIDTRLSGTMQWPEYAGKSDQSILPQALILSAKDLIPSSSFITRTPTVFFLCGKP